MGIIDRSTFLQSHIRTGCGKSSRWNSRSISGWLTDIGIDDDVIKNFGSTLQAGNSALFILLKKVTPDKIIHEIKEKGVEGTILQTSLSADEENRLQEILKTKLPQGE